MIYHESNVKTQLKNKNLKNLILTPPLITSYSCIVLIQVDPQLSLLEFKQKNLTQPGFKPGSLA